MNKWELDICLKEQDSKTKEYENRFEALKFENKYIKYQLKNKNETKSNEKYYERELVRNQKESVECIFKIKQIKKTKDFYISSFKKGLVEKKGE